MTSSFRARISSSNLCRSGRSVNPPSLPVLCRVSDAGQRQRRDIHQWPASESRQGKNPRGMGREECRALRYGDLADAEGVSAGAPYPSRRSVTSLRSRTARQFGIGCESNDRSQPSRAQIFRPHQARPLDAETNRFRWVGVQGALAAMQGVMVPREKLPVTASRSVRTRRTTRPIMWPIFAPST
jgi:hypothetical protein